MTIVDGEISLQTYKKLDEEIANEPTQEEIEKQLLDSDQGRIISPDVEFTKPNGKVRRGYYIDNYLLSNINNYLIKAVKKKWDGVIAITGMEGSVLVS